MSTLHSLCSRMGPVSRPASAQNTEKPAFESPSMRVLMWRRIWRGDGGEGVGVKECEGGGHKRGGEEVKVEERRITVRVYV